MKFFVKIFYGSKSITIELTGNRTEAILKVDRKEMKRLNVQLLPSGKGMAPYAVHIPLEAHEEYSKRHLISEISKLATGLVALLVSLPIDKNDMTILSNDDSFMHLFNETTYTLRSREKEFIQRRIASRKIHRVPS